MDDIDNQLNIPESNEKTVLIIKGRFKSSSLNFYGLFLIIFNSRGDIELHHIVVSTYSNIYEIEPHFGWEQFEEMIVNSKWKGSYNTNMTASIESHFKRMASEDSLQKKELFDFVKNYDYHNVDMIIFDALNRVIQDKNLIMESGIQELTETEYRESKQNIGKTLEDKKEVSHDGDNTITLSLDLILAPVSGKPIYELKIGDIIMAKIKPENDRANYYIDLLNLRIDDTIKPVPSEVIDIKSGGKSEPLEILTKIGPGIFGKSYEEIRQVKLRMYDPRIDEAVSTKKMTSVMTANKAAPKAKSAAVSEGFPKITYFIIILVILFFILFVAFFMML